MSSVGRSKLSTLAAVAVIVLIACAAALLLFLRGDSGGEPKAAIVDQLALTFPNSGFVDKATETLQQAGYAVDYYPGEAVTVDFYRRLPTHGYDVIVLRSHADRLQTYWEGEEIDEVVLFTNEPFDGQKYLREEKRLTIARYYEGGEPYFGIPADFIDESMVGRFDDTTIIMMGCEGLLSERTAEAFIEKGADVYISWDNAVSASHTDAASELLLEHLYTDGLSVAEAVARTMAEVGPDPAYGSNLLVYPPGA
jgi:hypothetical protein